MSEVAELQQQQQNGGGGTADWAIEKAGGIGEQHAVSNIDNTIALKGGRRRRRKSTKCGGRARRGKSRKNTSRRSRKGTRRH